MNDTWICDKGRFAHQFVDHDERLRTPLIRRDGQLQPASWDEALAYAADRLNGLRGAKGAVSIGGIASGRISNEAAYLLQKLLRVVVGSNNIDFGAGSAVRALPTGLPSISDVAKHDVIVLAGLDPAEAAPVLDLFLKRAVRRNGAKLVVLNPRKIEAVRYTSAGGGASGVYLGTRPGAEAMVMSALASSVLASRQDAGKRRSGSQGTANDEWSWLRSLNVTQTANVSGVAADDLESAAKLVAGAANPLFIYGAQFAIGDAGHKAVGALTNLAIAAGHSDKLAFVGGEANSQGLRDMGCLPDVLPGHQPVGDAAVRERLGKLWGVQPPTERGQTYQQMVGGGVRGLIVMGDDPARRADLKRALSELHTLVVADLFLTETAAMADVVFPLASHAEVNGTYTNMERRVQRAPEGIRPAGESRADWHILHGLADRLLQEQTDDGEEEVVPDWKKKRRKAKSASTSSAKPWNYPSANVVLEEIGKAVPVYAGIRWESLGEAGIQWSTTQLVRAARRPEVIDLSKGSPATSGGFALVSDQVLWDDGITLHFAADEVRNLVPAPFVALCPEDVASLGLLEGTAVTVTSERGSAELVLKADPAVIGGTAWIPLGLASAPAEMLGGISGAAIRVNISSK